MTCAYSSGSRAYIIRQSRESNKSRNVSRRNQWFKSLCYICETESGIILRDNIVGSRFLDVSCSCHGEGTRKIKLVRRLYFYIERSLRKCCDRDVC